MSGLFNKLKTEATKAGKKAQATVEVNRLKMKISSTEKELATIYQQMGGWVYRAIQNETLEHVQPEIQLLYRKIKGKEEEITAIEDKIRILHNEKSCPSCQKDVTIDIKFCPGCGHHFV